ncbi:hypothetical protein [Micromonospora sp. NBC_01796]|uniref:hypothetical protein n=1 Tax=Micromonospora sp. NBC_01796 TaxID=2975987 RepID=UPI002DD8D53D|nr:hypothetical protein [Micromonospora sp. NBC_01796]WSA86638.1 hypothetical protein OIE47_03170 [Micromonospora sp. NBC_01796]
MYTRQELVHAYLGAQGRSFGGYYPESSVFNAALKTYHTAMLEGLQELFGLRMHPKGAGSFDSRVLLMLFYSTAESLLALRTPWSGFLEAGLLVRKVEETGEHGARVMSASQRIDTLVTESRQTHLELLDALVAAMLGDRADLTFTRADLQLIGIDDTRPSPADYPLYED